MLRCLTYDCRQSIKFITMGKVFTIEDERITLEDSEPMSKEESINFINELINKKAIVRCPNCREEYSIFSLIEGYNKPEAIFDISENDFCTCGGEIEFILKHRTKEEIEKEKSKLDAELNGGEFVGGQRKVVTVPAMYQIRQCNKCGYIPSKDSKKPTTLPILHQKMLEIFGGDKNE